MRPLHSRSSGFVQSLLREISPNEFAGDFFNIG
jgi:hypothetical protein